MYKDDLEFGEGIQNDEVWKETSKILNTKTFGKALGDVLEGYFVCASEIIDEGKNENNNGNLNGNKNNMKISGNRSPFNISSFNN